MTITTIKTITTITTIVIIIIIIKNGVLPANGFNFSFNKEPRRQGALSHLRRRHHDFHSEKN